MLRQRSHKWLDFDGVRKATLSDGRTRVNVRFVTPAVEAYESKYKKKLTEGTLGGLVQLLEFQFKATHLGPRADRITLYVEAFKILGSEGAGIMGDTPRPIELRPGIAKALEDLAVLRNKELDSGRTSRRLSEVSSFGSQQGHASSSEDHQLSTEQVFASQAPLVNGSGRPNTNARFPPQDSRLNTYRNENAAASQAKSGESVATVNTNVNLSIERNNESLPKTRIIPKGENKSGPSKQVETLLGLLPQTKKTVSAKRNMIDVISPTKPVSPLKQDTLMVDMVDTKDEDASAVRANSIKDPDPVSGSTVGSPDEKPQAAIADAIPQPPPQSKPDMPDTETPATQVTTQPASRRRISTRDIRVSKDQAKLLDSADSWLPAQPGHREPVANIPISILKTLNRDADARATSAKLSRKQNELLGNSTRPRTAETASQISSDSDVPVSSGQWPASPDRDELPPDSSMDSVWHNDRATISLPTHHARRESQAPLPSYSKHVPSPSPLRTSFSREMSPVAANPELLSPSLVSTSADEGTGLSEYRCSEIGCDKSYQRSASLKAQIDRDRKDTRSIDAYKCPELGCDKAYPSLDALKYHTKKRHVELSGSVQSHRRSSNSHNNSPLRTGINSRDLNMTGTLSRSPSPDSDVEMTVPNALYARNDANSDGNQSQFPSTAPQSDVPFTQVNRTPYTNGHVGRPSSRSSPLKVSHKTNESLAKDVTHVTSSLQFTSRSAEDHQADASAQRDGDLKIRPGAKVIGGGGPVSNQATDFDEKINGHINEELEYVARPNSGAPPIDLEDVYFEVNELASNPQSAKRKAPSAVLLSPNNPKRQKRFKITRDFGSVDEDENRHDPVEGARRYRKEFLESRTSSASSTPVESPTKLPVAIQLNGSLSDGRVVLVEQPEGVHEAMTDDGASSPPLQQAVIVEDAVKTTALNSSIDVIEASGASRERQNDNAGAVESLHKDTRQANADEQPLQPLTSPVIAAPVFNPESPPAGPGAKDEETIYYPTVSMDLRDTAKDEVQSIIDAPRPNPAAILPVATEASNKQTDASFTNEPEAKTYLPDLDNNGFKSPLFRFRQDESGQLPKVPHVPSALQAPHRTEPSKLCAGFPDPLPRVSSEKHEGKARTIVAPPNDLDSPILDQGESATNREEPEPRAASPELEIMDGPPGVERNFSMPIAVSTLSGQSSLREVSVESRRLPEQATNLITKRRKNVPELAKPTLFTKFTAAYPSYTGDKKHFTMMCTKIARLDDSSRMEHQSLWDDFIIRHSTDYQQYMKSAGDAKTALPYEEYYRKEVEEPLHHSRIVNRRNLPKVPSLIEKTPGEAMTRLNDAEIIGTPHTTVRTRKTIPISDEKKASRQSRPEARNTIDLTEDGQASDSGNIAGARKAPLLEAPKKKPRHSLPWEDVSVISNTVADFTAGKDPVLANPAREKTTSAKSVEVATSSSPKEEPRETNKKESPSKLTEFWQDENSPFKNFMRQYISITPGRGNSFARHRGGNETDQGQARRETNPTMRLKQMDILGWYL